MEYLEINNIEQLRKLKSITKNIKKIELKLPFLSNSENQLWEQRIQKVYSSCGCDSGSLFVSVGVIISLGYCIFCYIMSHTISVKWIGFSLLILALIGKIYGLVQARMKLIRMIRQLTNLQHFSAASTVRI